MAVGGKGGKKKEKNPWLEAFRKTRKEMPPPTQVKPGSKGKGVPYRRRKEDWEGRREGE